MSPLAEKIYAKFSSVGQSISRETLISDLTQDELAQFANAVREARKEGKLLNDVQFNPETGVLSHNVKRVG